VLLAVSLLGPVAALAGAAGAKLPPPQLRLTSRAPVTVAGAHFRARERVVLRFAEQRRVIRTDRRGAFVVRLPFRADPCSDTVVVVATGARGETARVKSLARMCPPAP
jgi:hypothetical protein